MPPTTLTNRMRDIGDMNERPWLIKENAVVSNNREYRDSSTENASRHAFFRSLRNIATMTPISKEIGGYINRFTGANQRGIDCGKDMNQHLAHAANTTYGCDRKRSDGRVREAANALDRCSRPDRRNTRCTAIKRKSSWPCRVFMLSIVFALI